MRSAAAPWRGVALIWLRESFQVQNRGRKHPFPPIPSGSSSGTSFEALQQEQHRLQSEQAEVKGALAEEKELHAKRHEDLFTALTAKLSSPAPSEHPMPPCF